MNEQVRLERVKASPTPRPSRLLAIVIAVVVVIGVLGYGGYSLIRSGYVKPVGFDTYPSAKLVSQKSLSPTSDIQTYSTTNSVQEVLAFYVQRYGEVNNSQDVENGCVQVYTDATPSEAPGHSLGRCLYQDSFGDINRTVTIKIDFQPDTTGGTTGKTVITVERTWGS